MNTTDSVCSTAFENLVNGLSDKIDNLTSAGSQQPTEGTPRANESRHSTEPRYTTGSPGPEYADIPDFPHEDDYKHLKHWGSKLYNAIRHGKQAKGDDGPALCLFWELPDGGLVPPDRRKAVTNDLRAWWKQKHDDKVQLKPIMEIGWKLRDEYRSYIEAKHPWLRLCADHWKADMLWKNHFSTWTPAEVPTNGEGSTSLKREHSPEGEAGPSSKKLKSVAAAEPEVRKSRPMPTKINAKVSPPP